MRATELEVAELMWEDQRLTEDAMAHFQSLARNIRTGPHFQDALNRRIILGTNQVAMPSMTTRWWQKNHAGP